MTRKAPAYGERDCEDCAGKSYGNEVCCNPRLDPLSRDVPQCLNCGHDLLRLAVIGNR
jgi:hypothetical protein